MFSVSATKNTITVFDPRDGRSRTLRFTGTRQAGDAGRHRTTCQVAIRWAELTGTRKECARAAWRRAALTGVPRRPSCVNEDEWADILTGLDAAIAELVNDPSSKFYIYG
jgi:hypothetical protein